MDSEVITIDSEDDEPSPVFGVQNGHQGAPPRPAHLSFPGQIVGTVLPTQVQSLKPNGPRILFLPAQQIRNVHPVIGAQTAEQKSKSFPSPVISRVEQPRQSVPHVKPMIQAGPKLHLKFHGANRGQHLGSAFMGKGGPANVSAMPAEAATRPATVSHVTAPTPQFTPGTLRQKYPNRPSKFSSFLLFSQKQRERLLKENKDLSFCEVGRTLGKLWRELSLEEKNKYRIQARQLQEQKYVAWEKELMKLSGPAQLQYLASTTKQHKRRRKSGYDVFMIEMRKSLGGGLSQPEIMKKIGEAWRSAPDETRNQYERRADALNRETETHSSFEEKRRDDSEMNKILQLMRDSKEGRANSMPEMSNQTLHTPISKNHVGNGNFVSSEPPKLSRGISFQRFPAPPPLVLGGKSIARTYEMNDSLRQQLKRNHPNELPSNHGASIVKRSASSSHDEAEQRQIQAPLCRLCGQRGLKYTELVNKPDIVQSIKTVLELEIDIQKDELAGYPSTVCLKCLGLLTSLESFRSCVVAGQEKLKLLTGAVLRSNGTSLFPCPTKRVPDQIERNSVRPATNHAKILSNKPNSQPTIVKTEFSDEVEMLEDELLRLEEQEKEDAEKSLLDQDNLAPFFDDSHASELKEIAGISDDDEDDDFVEDIVDELDLIKEEPGTLQREISPINSNEPENFENITVPQVAEKVFQIGKDNGMTEIYKYFRMKEDEDETEKADIDDEDENEVEEIDCRDVS